MSSIGGRRPSAVLPGFLAAGAIGALSFAAAHSVAGMGTRVPKPLVVLLALAGAAIMLSITAEQLLFGWLFLAPLFQESASANRVGHALALALYAAPPAVLVVK